MGANARKILSPDTSAINRIADDPYSEALIAGLKSGYFMRFPFTTVSEIIATSEGARRAQLLKVARRLLAVAGDCIEPHHEIIKIMVARFEKSLPLGLAHVNLRMTEAENEILSVENFDDTLATQERAENRINGKAFDGVYANAKVAFDRLSRSGTQMPNGVEELVSQLMKGGAALDAGTKPLRTGCYETRHRCNHQKILCRVRALSRPYDRALCGPI